MTPTLANSSDMLVRVLELSVSLVLPGELEGQSWLVGVLCVLQMSGMIESASSGCNAFGCAGTAAM